MPRVLLIARTRSQGESPFAEALEKRYTLQVVPSGKQALTDAQAQPPQVIVLDAISMRTPGDRICKQLKTALPTTWLIHLHPGPENGADSLADALLYPPFTWRKVVNKIDHLLSEDQHVVRAEALIVCGPFAMDPVQKVLTAHGDEIRLTPKLVRLVEIFMRNPGVTLARRDLMAHVWNTDYLGDTRTLDVHIRWIRRAIETDPSKPQYLKTVRGVGYRLEVPMTALPNGVHAAALLLQEV
ncbi:MAG: response regulator transcription factor [Chloroflexi bacterium]|nr:response regulator transcription factor [Chloroflexota bacterium]